MVRWSKLNVYSPIINASSQSTCGSPLMVQLLTLPEVSDVFSFYVRYIKVLLSIYCVRQATNNVHTHKTYLVLLLFHYCCFRNHRGQTHEPPGSRRSRCLPLQWGLCIRSYSKLSTGVFRFGMLPSDYQKLTKTVFKIATVSDGASHFTALKLQSGNLRWHELQTSNLWKNACWPWDQLPSPHLQAPVSQHRLRRGTESRSSGSHGLAATSGAALCLVAAAGAVRSRKTTVTWEPKQPEETTKRGCFLFWGWGVFFFCWKGGEETKLDFCRGEWDNHETWHCIIRGMQVLWERARRHFALEVLRPSWPFQGRKQGGWFCSRKYPEQIGLENYIGCRPAILG